MPSSSNATILAAAGSAAMLLLAITSFSKSKKPSSTSIVLKDVEDIELEQEELSPEECIQPEDVVAIFDDLFITMQGVIARLSNEIQKIQMAGHMIPEKQLRQILKSEFERGLMANQKVVFEKHDVDEECLKNATWGYLNEPERYPKVKTSVERFQKLYEQISGEKVVGIKPGDKPTQSSSTTITKTLTKEELLNAASVYFDALTECMGSLVSKFKADGKNLNDLNVAQQLQMQFATMANDAGDDALEKIGVSSDGFKSSIEKFSTDPEVGRALAMLQMKQQQELMAMGVPVM